MSRNRGHRLAPGECTLRALYWEGDLPLPGQYLKAAKGRTAYLITGVRPLEAGRRRGAHAVAIFTCERRKPDTLRPDDVVHGWQWAAR